MALAIAAFYFGLFLHDWMTALKSGAVSHSTVNNFYSEIVIDSREGAEIVQKRHPHVPSTQCAPVAPSYITVVRPQNQGADGTGRQPYATVPHAILVTSACKDRVQGLARYGANE